ncbi:MAG: zinc-ribbon domain-containing protein [Lachnospiraceae bacterium]|nr:zinc-ribbon domain-containing protein [Lachnospiraceae bacterium]
MTNMFCKNCGANIPDGSRFCPECGTSFEAEQAANAEPQYQEPSYQQPQYQQPQYQQPQYQQPYQPQYQQTATAPDGKPLRGNGFAITGLVLAILTVFLCWIPFFGPLLGIAAVIFSALGIRTQLKAMGITALVISILFLIVGVFITVITIIAMQYATSWLDSSGYNLNDFFRFFEQFGDSGNYFR